MTHKDKLITLQNFEMAYWPEDLLEQLNQPAMGRRQEKWDRRYLKIAEEVSSWSKDPSKKVGCVIVKDNGMISEGYNGFPSGVEDTPERLNNRELKNHLTVHAEENAILKVGKKAQGGTLYLYGFHGMCSGCAKSAIQAGISRVVVLRQTETPEDKAARERWSSSLELAQMMLNEAGIITETLDEQ